MMKSLFFQIVFGAIVSICLFIPDVLSVNSPKHEKGKEIVPNNPQPHRPNMAAAMTALHRAHFHATNAAFSEDRAWRTDNQLHRVIDIAKYHAHKKAFKEEQDAFHRAWHGEQGDSAHTPHQQLQPATQAVKQEVKESTKSATERKRKTLSIGGDASVAPSKQLRIGPNTEHVHPNVASSIDTPTKRIRRAKVKEVLSNQAGTTEASETPRTQHGSKTVELPRVKKESSKSRGPRKSKDQ